MNARACGMTRSMSVVPVNNRRKAEGRAQPDARGFLVSCRIETGNACERRRSSRLACFSVTGPNRKKTGDERNQTFHSICVTPAMTNAVLRNAPTAEGSTRWGCNFRCKEQPETRERSRRSIPTAAGWFFARPSVAHEYLVAALSCPGRSATRAKGEWCAADPGPLRSVAVPDQRRTASLTLALHRVRDTR
jgi:hypothetical protein